MVFPKEKKKVPVALMDLFDYFLSTYRALQGQDGVVYTAKQQLLV